jgi:hypothetical protein
MPVVVDARDEGIRKIGISGTRKIYDALGVDLCSVDLPLCLGLS